MEDSERQFWIHNLAGPSVFYLLGTAGCGTFVLSLMKLPLSGSSTQASSSTASELSTGVSSTGNCSQSTTVNCLHLDIAPPQKWEHIKRSVPTLWRWLHFFNMLSDKRAERAFVGQCSRSRVTEQGTRPDLLQLSETPARGCAITSTGDESHSCFSCQVAVDVWTGLNLHAHTSKNIHTEAWESTHPARFSYTPILQH